MALWMARLEGVDKLNGSLCYTCLSRKTGERTGEKFVDNAPKCPTPLKWKLDQFRGLDEARAGAGAGAGIDCEAETSITPAGIVTCEIKLPTQLRERNGEKDEEGVFGPEQGQRGGAEGQAVRGGQGVVPDTDEESRGEAGEASGEGQESRDIQPRVSREVGSR